MCSALESYYFFNIAYLVFIITITLINSSSNYHLCSIKCINLLPKHSLVCQIATVNNEKCLISFVFVFLPFHFPVIFRRLSVFNLYLQHIIIYEMDEVYSTLLSLYVEFPLAYFLLFNYCYFIDVKTLLYHILLFLSLQICLWSLTNENSI